MTDHHRKKANKRRNGRSRYEKGRRAHDRHPPKKMFKRYSPGERPTEKAKVTLGDFWPES